MSQNEFWTKKGIEPQYHKLADSAYLIAMLMCNRLGIDNEANSLKIAELVADFVLFITEET